MYFDIYIGVCHPLIVYTMYVEFNEGVITRNMDNHSLVPSEKLAWGRG